jgi:hypothetical protein
MLNIKKTQTHAAGLRTENSLSFSLCKQGVYGVCFVFVFVFQNLVLVLG